MIDSDKVDSFRSAIAEHGVAALDRRMTIVAALGTDELVYIPFEHIESEAKLVLVGITPGPNQLRLAYSEAHRLAQAGKDWKSIEQSVKAVAGFGGAAMRPRLLRMLKHFRMAAALGLNCEEDLWGEASAALHSTSVVPHAAFRKGKRFAGPFEEIVQSEIFKRCFVADFLPTISSLGPASRYIALGPTAHDALTWCIREELLDAAQLLGAFPHPSSAGGTQVDYYLRQKRRDELHPSDPVQGRLDWLDKAYAEFNSNAKIGFPAVVSAHGRLGLGVAPANRQRKASAVNEVDRIPVVASREPRRTTGEAAGSPEKSVAPIARKSSQESPFSYTVGRGRDTGTVLRPHRHADDCYVVSYTRFKRDYVRVPVGERLTPWLRQGYSLRMSAPGRPPVLVSPLKIVGSD